MTDADKAMSEYASGNASAFEVVYEAVAPRLASYLHRHLRDKILIEDAIQQTFLHMHRARGTFIDGAAVLPWAFGILRRLMIDFARKKPREEYLEVADGGSVGGVVLAASVANGEEVVTAQETEARLSDAYKRLTEPQRAAYDLVTAEGMSHAEAAGILGTTVTGVKLRVHRVYLTLRAAVDDEPVPCGLSAQRAPR